MIKRDLAYELSTYSRREISQIVKAALCIKKYYKLTDEDMSMEEMIEELENDK